MSYRHSQTTFVALVVSDVVFALTLVIMIAADSPVIAIVSTCFGFAALAALIFGFSRLTVTIENGVVTTAFAWGWPRHRIDLSDVVRIGQVRNRWYHGWGIRKVSRGWMYNVWGLDAIELERRSGKVFRIGTDEPAELARALGAATAGRLTG